jgi:glyoxylase-like metal-dependent hydrolase (beta-lactamase superfamily II)
VEVDRIAEGLWRWTTRHPEWTPDADWPAEVGCVYYEAADAVVLVDPLVPADPSERDRFWRALDRDVGEAARPLAVLLTVFWHERSAQELVDRYDDATLWAHQQALERLDARVTNPFLVGDPLPGSVEAHQADRRDEVLLWIGEHRTLVAGDVLLGGDDGGVRLCPDSWLPDGVDPREFRAGLRSLLDLPIERILVSHGHPVLANGRDALARALADDV